MTAFMKKVRDEEPPEDEPEVDPENPGEQKPPYYSILEQEVKEALENGEGPSHDMNIRIIKEAMQSSEAKTKGLVLDLEYYAIPDEREIARKKAAEEELAKLEAEEAAAAEGEADADEKKDEEDGAEQPSEPPSE